LLPYAWFVETAELGGDFRRSSHDVNSSGRLVREGGGGGAGASAEGAGVHKGQTVRGGGGVSNGRGQP